MRREGFNCAVVCCLILIGIPACHRVDQDQRPAPVSDEEEIRSDSTVAPSMGSALGEGVRVPEPAPGTDQRIDNLWMLFPGEPQRSFRKGREDFLSKKYRTASEYIQKSTIYVRLQSLRAFGPAKRALLDSEAALRILAKDVEKGKIYSLARMDATYAAALRAIARLHLEKANGAYARRELQTAGIELQGAKDSLRRAAAWTGDHVDPYLIECSDRAADAAKRLMEGEDRVPAATRKALSDLGPQLDRLERKVEAEEARGLFMGETQFYLKGAEDRFEHRDMTGAAGNMRKAGACMALEAFGSPRDAKLVIEKEVKRLDETAEEVENGSLKSVREVRRRFAGAQYALARVHHILAEQYHARHYYGRAVTFLQATAADLERAVEWTGKGLKNTSIRSLQQVSDMSKRMREGLPVNQAEISTALSELKKAVARHENLALTD